MTPEQLRQALALLVMVTEPMAKKTGTEADDIGVEFAKALADSPAMLDFICRRALGNPAVVQQLMAKLTA